MMPSDEEPRLHRYPAYVRESPYLEFAIAEGAVMAWPYNRMWLPGSFGRHRRVESEALLESLALVGVRHHPGTNDGSPPAPNRLRRRWRDHLRTTRPTVER